MQTSFPQRGHVWLANLDKPDRPVIILSIDALNKSKILDVCVVPLTHIQRPEFDMRLFIPKGVGGTTMDCWAKCDQVHTIPKDVLTRQAGILPNEYFQEVEDRVKFSLGFDSGFSSTGRVRVSPPR